MFKHNDFDMPTVNDMDRSNDALKVNLLLLRTLCTSDFVFHYMIYDVSTIKDIVYQAKQFIDPKWDPRMFVSKEDYYENFVPFDPNSTYLKPYEVDEYKQLVDTLEQYINQVEG